MLPLYRFDAWRNWKALFDKEDNSKRSLVGFIYSHSSSLSLLREFTSKKELVRHTITWFAISYLSLQRLHQENGHLRKMFTLANGTRTSCLKEAKGRKVTKIILVPSFGIILYLLPKVMTPHVMYFV